MATCIGDTDFPPYVIKCMDDTHFLVAGGGGEARTGVPNAMEIFEIVMGSSGMAIQSKCRFDTDNEEDRSAIMNAALRYDGKVYLMAAGKDERCQMYEISKTVSSLLAQMVGNSDEEEEEKKESKDKEVTVRKRKKKSSESNGKKKSGQRPTREIVKFDVQRLKAVQTDFHETEASQNAVCFSPNGMYFVSGGADGHLRMWSYPSMEKVYDVEAHSKEIEDVIISPLGNKLITISRDQKAYVWNTKDGSKMCALEWEKCADFKSYRFGCCRFAFLDGDVSNSTMFTTNVPHIQKKGKQPSYLTKWNSMKFTIDKTVCTGDHILSALAVSHSGYYVGVGTMSGAVGIYITFSLQKLKWVNNAHGIFITGLTFIPMTSKSRSVVGDKEAAVLSIAADKKMSLVSVSRPGEYPVMLMFLGAFIIIILIFTLLASLGADF
ncbi:guanine nucleotide-exchange factor SEC12-like [Diadema antillarum]|uniref:guanine nucleotide-exchange factor SEC12-like n=1 Tax=Diadema antillarum TaxID=105358 RepID=UPI003A897473